MVFTTSSSYIEHVAITRTIMIANISALDNTGQFTFELHPIRKPYLNGAMSKTRLSGRRGEAPPKTVSQAAGIVAWCWWAECSGVLAAGQLPASL